MIPREVATFGRYAARRTGLDPDDGESIAGETWAAYPTQEGLWRTITLRRCVDEARRRHGRQGQHHDPYPILDQPILEEDTPLDLTGAEDPNLEQAEIRADLATLLASLDDRDLAALARHYWLGIPNGMNTPAAYACARAIRRARRSAPEIESSAPEIPPTLTTPRQTRMLELAAAGMTNEQIAAELTLSANTVKRTLQNAYSRIGAKDRAHAVAMLMRAGLIA